jgi:hypothetical protein
MSRPEIYRGTGWLHHSAVIQWIGLGENLQENPTFNGKNHGFL